MNKCNRRRYGREAAYLCDGGDYTTDPAQVLERRELTLEVFRRIDSLPTEMGGLLAALIFCGGNVRKLARSLNTPHRTIADRVDKMRSILKNRTKCCS